MTSTVVAPNPTPNPIYRADDYESAIHIGMAKANSDEELLNSSGPLREAAEKLLKDPKVFHRIGSIIGGFCDGQGALESLDKHMRNNCYAQIGRNNQFLRIHPDELQVYLELRSLEDVPWVYSTGTELIAIVRFK